MMEKIEYIRPDTIEEALHLLSNPTTKNKILAGGTDIMVQIRIEPPDYDRFVDISRVPEMKQIKIDNGKFLLGAGLTHEEVASEPSVLNIIPFLAQACSSVGSPQIRNTGTLGGNIGNAAACADSLPVLVCLDAVACLRSESGERMIPVSELVIGPHKTQIGKSELITHFSFPLPPMNTKSRFIKIGRRNSQSISRLSIAAMGKIGEGGLIDFIRICPGAATPQTKRFTDVEDFLVGKPYDDKLFAQAGERMAAKMIEFTGIRWSTKYKEVALKAITERVLREVLSSNISVAYPDNQYPADKDSRI